MSKYCLQLKPHPIDYRTWWYEDARGALVYLSPDGVAAADRCVCIPVGQLRQYLKRLDAKPNPRIKKQSKKKAAQRKADA